MNLLCGPPSNLCVSPFNGHFNAEAAKIRRAPQRKRIKSCAKPVGDHTFQKLLFRLHQMDSFEGPESFAARERFPNFLGGHLKTATERRPAGLSILISAKLQSQI